MCLMFGQVSASDLVIAAEYNLIVHLFGKCPGYTLLSSSQAFRNCGTISSSQDHTQSWSIYHGIGL